MAYRYLKHNEKLLSLNGKLVKIETTEPTKTPETKTVTPTTTQQEITPTNSSYELNKVIVSAVTSSIDSNITPENIKKDITILGITGTCESGGSNDLKEILLGEWVYRITDTNSKIVIVFSSDDTCGIWIGKHEPSTVTLDKSYTISGNTISIYETNGNLYCTGTYENKNYNLTLSLEDTGGNIQVFTKILKNNLQEKTISPTTSEQTIYADSEYEALKSVTVGAVTADIDTNIIADNIKKDVTILGVTGTCETSGSILVTNDPILGDIVGNWKYTDSESGGYYLLTLNEDYSGTLTMNDGTTSNSSNGTFTLSGLTINFTYSGNTLEYTVKILDNKRVLNQTLGNLRFNKLTPTLTYDEASGTLTITYGGN